MRIAAIALFTVLALATAAPAQSINDAQIAAIVVAANQVDSDAGELAVRKTTNADVRKFAQTMVNDHTGVNKTATELVTKLKVTPQDNPTAQALRKGGDENLAKLKTL